MSFQMFIFEYNVTIKTSSKNQTHVILNAIIALTALNMKQTNAALNRNRSLYIQFGELHSSYSLVVYDDVHYLTGPQCQCLIFIAFQ